MPDTDMLIADDEPAAAGGFPSGILGDQLQDGTVPRSPPPSAEPPPAVDDNPLMHALAAQTRAEEMQRQAPQRPPPSAIEHHIDSLPGLSEHKRAFLKQFPVLIQDRDVMAVFNKHYAEALRNGFTDDTAELDNHLITETVRDVEHRRQLALAAEPVDVAVQRLEDEAAAIDRSEQRPAPIAPPPMPAARRSIPMSAPVSRESYGYSGKPQSDTRITLSPDERFIAHTSFPHLSKSEAEFSYAKNKRLMVQRKADGSIQGDG